MSYLGQSSQECNKSLPRIKRRWHEIRNAILRYESLCQIKIGKNRHAVFATGFTAHDASTIAKIRRSGFWIMLHRALVSYKPKLTGKDKLLGSEFSHGAYSCRASPAGRLRRVCEPQSPGRPGRGSAGRPECPYCTQSYERDARASQHHL